MFSRFFKLLGNNNSHGSPYLDEKIMEFPLVSPRLSEAGSILVERWNTRNLLPYLCIAVTAVCYSSSSFSNCQSPEFERLQHSAEIDRHQNAIKGPLASNRGETVIYVDTGVVDQTRAWDVVNRVWMSVAPDPASHSNGKRMVQTSYSVVPREVNGKLLRATIFKKVRVNIGETQYFVDMKLVPNSQGVKSSAVSIEVTAIGPLPVKTRLGILELNRDNAGEIVDFALQKPEELNDNEVLHIKMATSTGMIDSYSIQLQNLGQRTQLGQESGATIGPENSTELAVSEYIPSHIELPQFDRSLVP